MTAEEFHSALREATNYSLKGFVLPHLKQQLPSLQRDLSNAARTSNQVGIGLADIGPLEEENREKKRGRWSVVRAPI